MERIADEFGKKIGGSRRDQWRTNLQISDLLEMNEAEKNTYVKKNSIIPTLDYKKLAEDRPAHVVYFIKLAKDAIATKPACTVLEGYQEKYILDVTALRDEILSLKTWSECERFAKNYLLEKGLIEESTRYMNRYETTMRGTNVGAAKIFNALASLDEYKIKRQVRVKEFLYSDYDKFKKKYSMFTKGSFTMPEPEFLRDCLGSTTLVRNLSESMFNLIKDEQMILVSNHNFIAYGSKEHLEEIIAAEFEKHQKAQAEANAGTTRKKRFVPPKLERCERTINGENAFLPIHVSTDLILDTFKFHGGEFGTWLNDTTRAENLDRSYEAFLDFATALGVKPEDITLGSMLSIAYGARGRGGSAVATYEPMRHVINLTRNRGCGSLGHELWHFLDYSLSELAGNKGPFSENLRTSEAMKKLVSVMKYKDAEVTVSKSEYLPKLKHYRAWIERTIEEEFYRASDESKAEVRKYMNDCILNVNVEDVLAKNTKGMTNEEYINEYVHSIIDRLNELKSKYVPKSKKVKQDNEFSLYSSLHSYYGIMMMPEEKKEIKRVKTDFYSDSIQFDELFSKDSFGYWQSTVEMTARAFACWLKDTLAAKGIRNDYLNGSCESAAFIDDGKVLRAYPTGDERKAINEAIDEFIAEVKAKGLLGERLVA